MLILTKWLHNYKKNVSTKSKHQKVDLKVILMVIYEAQFD